MSNLSPVPAAVSEGVGSFDKAMGVQPTRRVAARVLEVVLGILFLSSALTKLFGPDFERVTTSLLAAVGVEGSYIAVFLVARTFVVLELFLGSALVLRRLGSWALLLPVLFLVAVSAVYFSFFDGWAGGRCACGVPLWSVNGRGGFLVRNSLFVTMATILCLLAWRNDIINATP